MLKKRIVQYWTTIKDTCKKHKKTALAILLIIAVAAGGSVGYKLMTSTDSGVASNEKKLEQAKEAEEEAVKEEQSAEDELKDAEKELEKAKKSGDKDAIAKAEKKVEAAKEKVNSTKKKVEKAKEEVAESTDKKPSSSNSSASSSNSNKKPSNSGSNSSSSSGGSSASKPSKPSGGSSGSSGSSSSDSSTSKPSKPAHQHKWEPVYGEKTVTKYKKVPYGVVVCDADGCNAEFLSPEEDDLGYNHFKSHALNGESYSSHNEIRYKKEAYQDTETYIKYYRCTCGATK
ncbi:DUF1090 domain-containing protein [Gallibacter intestinalis]|uniref:C2H2-type domain-containing protein n=1 Tax=Gallibacter intestinalis TaxID=2779356 RepID=A0ABR9QZ69_9FIRM|nr:DUF1090 domain-containing protein [Gallibacter intestinalis]MBE5036179.1 hypothetical protein [Gallibacter intestinalis]